MFYVGISLMIIGILGMAGSVVMGIRNHLVYKIRTHVLFTDDSYELSAYKSLPSYSTMLWDLRKWRARDWLGEGW